VAGVDFSRHVRAYLEAGHHELVHLTRMPSPTCEAAMGPGRQQATSHPLPTRVQAPFVIVLSSLLVQVSSAVERLVLAGRTGLVFADTADVDELRPTAEVQPASFGEQLHPDRGLAPARPPGPEAVDQPESAEARLLLAGNRNTWLGAASCAGRFGAE